VGSALCEDPNIAMVSFTGSPEVGAKVGEACGRTLKKVQLELGGKNALIVLDDADMDVAASNAAWGTWLHQGQICMATGLILAPASKAEKLTETLATKAHHLPVGDPSKEECALGPLIALSEAKRIEAIVEDAVAKGATLHVGGKANGTLFPATVLSGVTPGMRAFDEEIFGPVAVITTYKDDDHAVELANMTEFGLVASVYQRPNRHGLALGAVWWARQVGQRLAHLRPRYLGRVQPVCVGNNQACSDALPLLNSRLFDTCPRPRPSSEGRGAGTACPDQETNREPIEQNHRNHWCIIGHRGGNLPHCASARGACDRRRPQ